MPKNSVSDQCTEDTQEFIINIPCLLAERVEKYAAETGNTIPGVVIEALDNLMRGRKSE